MPIIIKVVNSNPVHGEVYSIQHYVIKFVSDLRQVGGFLHQNTDRHDTTEILLKVALNTINKQTYLHIPNQEAVSTRICRHHFICLPFEIKNKTSSLCCCRF